MSKSVKIGDILKFVETPMQGKTFTTKMNVAIAANIHATKSAVEGYIEGRKKLLEKYAKKDIDGNFILSHDEYGREVHVFEDPEGYKNAHNELLETEVEVAVTMFPKEEFEKCEKNSKVDIPNIGETLAMMAFMVSD